MDGSDHGHDQESVDRTHHKDPTFHAGEALFDPESLAYGGHPCKEGDDAAACHGLAFPLHDEPKPCQGVASSSSCDQQEGTFCQKGQNLLALQGGNVRYGGEEADHEGMALGVEVDGEVEERAAEEVPL